MSIGKESAEVIADINDLFYCKTVTNEDLARLSFTIKIFEGNANRCIRKRKGLFSLTIISFFMLLWVDLTWLAFGVLFISLLLVYLPLQPEKKWLK